MWEGETYIEKIEGKEMKVKIEIISTINCPSCTGLKNILDELEVKYKEYRLEDHPWYTKTVDYRKFQGFPHLRINNEVVFFGKPHKNVIKRQLVKWGVLEDKNERD